MEKCPKCGYEESKIGEGYLAIPELVQSFYDRKDNFIQWWVVKKEFWEEHKYIDDVHLDLDIPNFAQDQESCFTYQPTYPSDNLHFQSSMLEEYGFHTFPLGTF
jgi:hypothetical protein